MSIARYGVVRGKATQVREASTRSQHYQVLIECPGEHHRIAVNVTSTERPHEVLYFIDSDYQNELLARLLDVGDGFTPVASEPGGLALDYVRGHLFETRRMRPLPAEAGADNDMNKVLGGVIARAMDEDDAVVFALGQGFPPDGQTEGPDKYFDFSPEQGIHDIHMNQGNGPAHRHEDGVWQDGGLFAYFPRADRWAAVFIAFQSQSFKTDASGRAAGASTAPRARRRRRDRKHHPMAPLGVSLSPMEVAEPARAREPGEQFVSTEIPLPPTRTLRAYAFDPSRGRVLNNEMKLDVRFRKLAPGPVEVGGDCPNRIAVVDYDGSTKRFYKPVDLDDERLLAQDGIWPTEADPRFHQQMVYAIARETIEHFETALGRQLHWRRAERAPGEGHGWKGDDIQTLLLYPHAMREANAYYSPEAHGILFGYFAADRRNTAWTLPHQPVFTCLSHDIIVHEMTHAIIDGQRPFLIERTNRDVAAFHEGFADLAALFRHFSHREVLIDTLQRTGGRLYSYQLRPDAVSDAGATPADLTKGATLAAQIAKSNPLIEVAQQFGDATGMRHALREALGTPATPAAYRSEMEPHARGSILVAAVFDAYFTVYVKRTSDLFRIYRAGGGRDNPVDLPGPLANLLCDAANETADQFFATCARALDYCPPVDLTFGEFLRALITAEVDRDPADKDGIREALMQAFRLRGIFPNGARFFSEDALTWTRGDDLDLPRLAGLHFGDPNGLTCEDKSRIAPVLHGYLDDPTVRARLGLDVDLPLDVPSFHPVFRRHGDGSLRRDMVVQAVQTRRLRVDGNVKISYPYRAGATLLIEPERDGPAGSAGAHVRWVIAKPMYTPGKRGNAEAAERHARQQAYLASQDLTGDIGVEHLHIDFGLVHGGM
ncbi:MAG TPA: DUF2278 family protein [Haliangiales bacterium]|nr:DUF2278 family protein [Haliangiales bacterium]